MNAVLDDLDRVRRLPMSGTATRTISQPACSKRRICSMVARCVLGLRVAHRLDGDRRAAAHRPRLPTMNLLRSCLVLLSLIEQLRSHISWTRDDHSIRRHQQRQSPPCGHSPHISAGSSCRSASGRRRSTTQEQQPSRRRAPAAAAGSSPQGSPRSAREVGDALRRRQQAVLVFVCGLLRLLPTIL